MAAKKRLLHMVADMTESDAVDATALIVGRRLGAS